MRVLFFGDIFGRPGRRAVASVLPDLKKRYAPDFIFGNAENLAGGRGVNRKTFHEMLDMGFQAMTTGNHVWDNREVFSILEADRRLLRPANLADPADSPCPGAGHALYESKGKQILLVNLIGRVFMDQSEDPFAAADWILESAPAGVPIFVDMHAEATSEKYAMGWYLNGKVAAMVGTHSHVQTADERLLTEGTAYITDVGMSGAFDSVIGMEPAPVIQRFRTKRPQGFHPALQNPGVGYVVVDIDSNGKALSIERVRHTVADDLLADERDTE
ncbi:YmdB family metallophosphoesterase [bacterium]|nr:YmdB family metallophosphoesterase [bacterium]